MTPPFPLVGELACLGAALSWAVSICLYRRYAGGIPAYAITITKNLVALAGLAALLVVFHPTVPTDLAVWTSLGLSGLFGVALSDTAALAALKRLGAPLSAVGMCLGPPLASLVAWMTLGETMSARELGGAAVTVLSVAGVLYFTNRGLREREDHSRHEVALGILFIVLSGVFHSIGAVLGRYGLQRSDVIFGTVLRLGPATLFLLPLALRDRASLGGWLGDRRRAVFLVLAALVGTFVGLLFMSAGLKFAKTGVATAILATYPIWVLPLAHRWLREPVSRSVLVCAALAIAGIVFLVCGNR